MGHLMRWIQSRGKVGQREATISGPKAAAECRLQRSTKPGCTCRTCDGPAVSTASPCVSVCIPTYRGGATIGAAIESVLAQSLTDFELVVVDDCSPDDTAAIVARYRDPRLRYLRNALKLGPEGNWNRCLAEAQGQYFKLLPHDDLLASRCLERQVAAFEADSAQRIAVVFGAREVIGPDGRVLTRRGYPGGAEGPIASVDLIRACLRRGTNLLGEPGAVLMRRSLADRVGSFDATDPYVIDLDYWFRLLAHGGGYYCDEILAGFRVSRSQWSVAIGAEQSSDFRRFVARIAARQAFPISAFDRVCARFTPALNNLARLLFYRLYLR